MKTILITGANRGIGLGLTQKFVDTSWNVIACCRHPDNAEALKRISNIDIVELDVGKKSSIDALANKVTKPIDILLNNAGILLSGETQLGELEIDPWLETLKINTIAPTLIAQALEKNVAKSQLKIIANMSSDLGSISNDNISGYYYYRTSKVALNIVTKNLSIDLKTKNIISVALHPGWVKTDMGGANAEITIEECVDGLYNVLTELNSTDNGTFIAYNGNRLPW